MDKPSLHEFAVDSQLLGLTVSPAQRVVLKALDGEALDAEELAIFQACTGRATYPGHPFGEATVIAGARAGKGSRLGAPTALHGAFFGGYAEQLARGEQAIIPLIAQDQRGTRVNYSYVKDYVLESPLLRRMLDGEPLTNELRLTNGVTVMCFPSTLRSMRGFSIPVAVLDEVAFYALEGQADSDVEIQASVRRGMLNFAQPRLLKCSTPYGRSGVLYADFQKAWGHEDPDLLVWRAPTQLMNPSITGKRLEREQRLDPTRFAREYLAEFSDDVAAFLPGAWIDDAVVVGRHELPAVPGVTYVAAVDPSGGGADAFTVAIVHVEEAGEVRRGVVDVVRGWGRRAGGQAPDLGGIVREVAATCRRYRIPEVHGDRYAAGWVRQAFQEAGLMYRDAELDKSRVYLEVEPYFAQGRVDLLDHPVLVRELKTLEKRPRSGGRDVMDHPRGGSR